VNFERDVVDEGEVGYVKGSNRAMLVVAIVVILALVLGPVLVLLTTFRF
jgi:hypothetical protein